MQRSKLAEKFLAMYARRRKLADNLIVPARAAANQMADAGMKNGAEPLKAILFEIEAIDQEIEGIVTSQETRMAALAAMEEIITGGHRGVSHVSAGGRIYKVVVTDVTEQVSKVAR